MAPKDHNRLTALPTAPNTPKTEELGQNGFHQIDDLLLPRSGAAPADAKLGHHPVQRVRQRRLRRPQRLPSRELLGCCDVAPADGVPNLLERELHRVGGREPQPATAVHLQQNAPGCRLRLRVDRVHARLPHDDGGLLRPVQGHGHQVQ
ncbi:unnamed protein product [Phaeothamnion confervicola]